MPQPEHAVPGGEPGSGEELSRTALPNRPVKLIPKNKAASGVHSGQVRNACTIWRATGRKLSSRNSPPTMIRFESRNHEPLVKPRAARLKPMNNPRCFVRFVSCPDEFKDR